MNFKKRANGSWIDTPNYIHKTDTDTLATLPVMIYPNDTTATVGLKGNTVQNGTPTPDNPITPVSTGDLETVGTKAGQYKIPISSANTTTPVYLGEVETTRKIKKLVLTGEEKFILKDRPDTANYMYALRLYHKNTIGVCSHLPYTELYPRTFPGFRTDASMQLMYMCIGPELQEAQPGGNTVEGFRYYLTAQYANGTPVTVWYVLAEPETAVVNEPLMKIGDYADEVSSISIPVTAGGDTLSVGTTVQPSEMTVNYKGWHPVSAVHECENGQWD